MLQSVFNQHGSDTKQEVRFQKEAETPFESGHNFQVDGVDKLEDFGFYWL